MEFLLEDLPAVRRLVGSLAIDTGLSDSRREALVLAVNEIASNAVIHGRPPARVRAWQAEGEIAVEVSDEGDGIRDVLAGRVAPPPTSLGGRGLWLARQLSDSVEIRNGERCAVTVRAATGPASSSGASSSWRAASAAS